MINSGKTSLNEVEQKVYEKYVKEKTPTKNLFIQMLKAFITGGAICTLGQFITEMLMKWAKLSQEDASLWTTLFLVFLSVMLTGLGVYRKIVSFGGAGALVPITGFANSVASPAIEFSPEGRVNGTGCKIFTIAGPVILYGLLCSWALGILYLIMGYLPK